MALDPSSLEPAVLEFLRERHLAVLVTQRADGSPHAVAVGFTYEPATRVARVITRAGSVKAANARRGGRAAVSQVDGPRWLTLEGSVRLATEAEEVRNAVAAYAERYRMPADRDDRVVVEIAVDRILGRG
ncbi:MAG: TIGR03618 family F420-dependent PPOX class oxidoreductase [Actinomycetota bacterium]